MPAVNAHIGLLINQCNDVRVVDILFLVCECNEFIKHFLQAGVIKGIAQFGNPSTKRMASAVLSENHVLANKSYVFRPHDFVGRAVLEHSMLMNARFVGERVLANNRLVSLNQHAGGTGNKTTDATQFRGVDPGVYVVIVAASLDRHHDLFERRISGTFTQTVNRTFDLACPRFDCSQTVRDRETQVVMTVSADDRFADI